MKDDTNKITIKIKEKEYKINSTSDLKLLNNEIISLLESIYDTNLKDSNNLYKIYYLDEESDKLYIKSVEDYNFFVNNQSKVNLIYLELDENIINKIKSTEKDIKFSETSLSDNELKLLEKIENLSKLNQDLKMEKEIYNKMNQIYKEKINILEENKKIKNEKEESILEALESEKREKKEIIEELEQVKKLNESLSILNNSISENDNIAKDILLRNLNEEKSILKNQLNDERKRIDSIEKIYDEDNKKLKQKLNNLQNEFDTQKQQILKNSELLIKNEIERGINDYINKSKINLEKKENEINKLKNDYENKINSVREECYQEIEEKYSKIYEEKIKQIYETAMNNSKIMCDNILSQNQQIFEEEEKKRNQIINSNLLIKSNYSNNFSKISQCKTIHNNITCNECNISPIVGYRYKCLECENYNLCEKCEKIVEHEHNFIKYVNEENDNKYSYECLSNKLNVSIYEGDKKASLRIILKNNGKLKWTEQTMLIKDNESKITCNNIKLKELNPEDQEFIEITFDNLNNLSYGNFSCNFLFSVNGKIYGKPLKTEIYILKK